MQKSNCTVFKNSNGVTIARHRFSTWEGVEATTQYYLYNPYSPYPGTVLSPVAFMEGVGSGRAMVEQQFADLVNSIRFVR